MRIPRSDFPSRLSFRAVVAGVTVTFAVAVFLMTLVGALEFWSFDIYELTHSGLGLWTWAMASWIIAVYVGSVVSAVAARSNVMRDGLLHGLMTWASSCAIGCTIMALGTERVFSGLTSFETSGYLWIALWAEAIAFGGALLGAANGVRSESNYDAFYVESASELEMQRKKDKDKSKLGAA